MREAFGLRRMMFLIQVNSCSVCALGCGVKGRCELSRKDSLVPSNRLFQRIREALDILYRRQMKSTEAPFR